MILQMAWDWARLQRSQWFRRDKLARLQAKKLEKLIHHTVRNVPFYRELYAEAGVDPNQITDTESIRRLPTITKQLLRNIPLSERTAVGADTSVCLRRTTSGSTGSPLTVLEEPRASAYRSALWWRRLWAYGVRPYHRICKMIPATNTTELSTTSKGIFGFVLRSRLRNLSLADEARDHVGMLLKWQPDVLVAPPSYLRSLINVCEGTRQTLDIRIVLSVGEILDPSTRKLICDRLSDEVYDNYGLVEVGGVAWECPTHSGYHVNSDSLVVELLRNGEPVASGGLGELCLTNLYRRVTPMVRYAIGDMASLTDDECSCGRGLPLLKEIHGRVVDYIVGRNGRQISPYTIMFNLETVSGIEQYKVTQKPDYSIEVLVQTRQANELDNTVGLIQERCKQLFQDIPVEVKVTKRIDKPPSGKFRVVESLVPK